MISLQTASPLHENCLHPMTLPSSRSSSRMRLCKDSMNPPSQGWPGGMNAWSVSCSPAQRPKAPAMNSGPLSALSAWGAPWARPAKSSISITSAAPMRRSTRKARCWRVNSSITLQTLKTRPFQSESNWKSMAHTCPGALASTRRCRRGAVRGLWALRGRTRSPFGAPQAPECITAHDKAFTLGPRPGAFIAPPSMRGGKIVHPLAHRPMITQRFRPARRAGPAIR